MALADGARQRRRVLAMMAGMWGAVRKWARGQTKTGGRCWLLASVCGLSAAAPGCAVDDRNVRDTPAELGASGAPGASDAAAVGSGNAGTKGMEGNSRPTGNAELGGSATGNTGLSGSAAGGSGSSGSGGSGTSPAPCPLGAQRCEAGALQLCNADGMWAALGTTCGECVPDTAECAGPTLRVCSSTGRWIERLQCAGSQPLCQAASGSCGCDESSCPLGQLCSSETRSCVVELSDCPVPSPIGVTEAHDLGIISVRFDAATSSADVRIQNIGTGSLFFAGVACNGADNCVVLREGVTIQLNARDTLDVTVPNTVAAGGELAVLNNYPDEAVAGFAYVAWGSGPSSNRLEMLGNLDPENWRPGERITVAPGDTGFVCTGNANEAAGYTSCSPARSGS